MNLIIPDRLKKGDTLGIVSPSAGLAPFAMHRIDNAVKYFQDMGYKVIIGTNALKNEGYVSASINDRVEDIHSMFLNPEVKAIICTIGGNNSNQLLPYIDFALIKNNPKIFIGYSDISVLHFAIQSQSNLATYFGPCVMTQFGEYPKPLPYTLDSFIQQLCNSDAKTINIKQSELWTDETPNWFEKKDLDGKRKQIENTGYEWLKKGKSSGTAWGGTIPSINYLLGTKYWVKPKNSIFFLDIPEGKDINSGLGLSEVDAYLTNLDNAGIFDEVKGIIVGRPYRYTLEEHNKLKEIILRITDKYDFPILYNANIGHVDPIITLRYGQKIEINSNKNYFSLLNN